MSDNKIIEAIRKMASLGFPDELYWMAANVNSVDLDKRTCSVTAITGSSDLEIPDVKLQAAIADGFLLVPAIDSIIFIAYSKHNEPFVALFSDIDYMLLVVGSSAIEITKDGHLKLNDGSYGGLIKIDELIGKINAIENKVNQIISAFNSHSHPSNGSITPTQISGSLANTQKSDIENSVITHGQ
jgi:hypothetical protein